jgi:hypothetical protein
MSSDTDRHLLAICAVALTLALPLPVQAAETSAGTVHAVSGGRFEAVQPDGRARNLAANGGVREGDVLRTSPDTWARVKFTDGSFVVLEPDSEFKVEQYQHSAQKPDESTGFFNLLKGGLRTLTGLIGKRRPDNYRMRAGTATIGIRGTDYSMKLCGGGRCATLNPVPEDGLYIRVEQGGSITVTSGTPPETITVTGPQGVFVGAGQAPKLMSLSDAFPTQPLNQVPANPAGCGG